MENVERRQRLPGIDRLSVLAATIMLAYTLTHFVNLPERTFSAQLPGIYLEIPFNIRVVASILVAGLMATGADWLLSEHPALKNRSPFPHWILPSLTALIIGIPLNALPYGLSWWLGLFAGAGLVVLVLLGEYIALDAEDVLQPVASAGLSAVSYALFLIVLTSLRMAGLRLFFAVPAVTLAAWLVSIRTLHLRLHGEWTIYEAGIIALVIGQLAAALHYWPLTPISFGLVLLGPTYALTSLFSNLIEERKPRQMILEPLLALLLTLGVAWLAR